ncbi:MAG: DUF262 domain-containing protein [Bacilli bacterium]|nr:DUF262 domain-containing protein [Bacilli bacterium]
MSKAILQNKLIHHIKGSFFVPAYQRGYRWDIEAERLLNDIQEAIDLKENTYCLQPIVVKKIEEDKYELIDGQQRLTTIYLIYKVLQTSLPTAKANFELEYETRQNSKNFIETINDNSPETFIDFFYMKRAYLKIKNWFNNRPDLLQSSMDFYTVFNKVVNVIWYEVGKSEDSNKLFQRLNIGKIPLTSAELVKALFLNEGNRASISIDRQKEISLQWDNIEKELHDDSLWFFLTNSIKGEYQTRIDLILDLVAKKKIDERDDYYTFFYFDKEKNNKDLLDVWVGIQRTFLVLKDWFHNHDLYHKIGYLIASNSKTLQEIYYASLNKKKSEFINSLDGFIRESIKIKTNYGDLSYQSSTDQKKIQRLLLLFNVESVRQQDQFSQWFSFDKFKGDETVTWSLEHIHAQNSDGLKTEEQWREWLQLHLASVKAIGGDQDLINRINQMLVPGVRIQGASFEQLQKEIVNILSSTGDVEYKHSIANLALLNTRDNAALNNSTFDVKRNEIIKMDMKGNFIPFCTKMVFLKYYTSSDVNNIHFWGQADREAYVKAINNVLKNYLSEEIILTKEDE